MNTMKLSSILIALLSLFLVFSCAGSSDQSDSDYLTDEERQEKELDDIEALLGISSTDSPQQQPGNQP